MMTSGEMGQYKFMEPSLLVGGHENNMNSHATEDLKGVAIIIAGSVCGYHGYWVRIQI